METVSKRINVILPDATVALLERLAPKGSRSRLISDAVLHYVRTRSRQNLQERLKEGYRENARLNLAIASEWFPLDREAWRLAGGSAKRKR